MEYSRGKNWSSAHAPYSRHIRYLHFRKVKIEGTATTEDFKIKSVGGGKKRKIDDSIEEQDESDTSGSKILKF